MWWIMLEYIGFVMGQMLFIMSQRTLHWLVWLFLPTRGGITEGVKLVYSDNFYMYGYVSGQINENLYYRITWRKGHTRA